MSVRLFPNVNTVGPVRHGITALNHSNSAASGQRLYVVRGWNSLVSENYTVSTHLFSPDSTSKTESDVCASAFVALNNNNNNNNNLALSKPRDAQNAVTS